MIHQRQLPTGDVQTWQRIEIVSGNTGGRWAYWAAWKAKDGRPGIGPHPELKAIADKIFNGDAAHFIGMLDIPYVRLPGQIALSWVCLSPTRSYPPPPQIEFEPKPSIRYEKSKEVFDVDTQTSRKL